MEILSPDARISLREINEDTVRAICLLSDTLSESHRRMVAPNAISIAEAHFSQHAWFRAIYADEYPVGFAMLYIGPGDPPEDDRTIYYLWRFMIGNEYQGMGYGRRALEAIIEIVKEWGAGELRLSCGEGEGSPEEFYRRLGFERDGLMYDDEVGMRMTFEGAAKRAHDGQLLHFKDPDRREFEAEILEQFPVEEGRFGIILNRTYFYPTGGGQEHDEGFLGTRRVVDVCKDEERGVTIHVVDGELPSGPVQGVIDSERRRRHMQHHTAQHLLSECFVAVSGLETVSANINGDSPSTLDLNGSEPSWETIREIEAVANRIIWEDREVKTYFASPDRLDRIPLRKPPKVSQDIRIVEIDGLDWSACGGTHVKRTGQIGVIKILRVEKVKEKTRIHFVAGERAFEHYQSTAEVAAGLAADLSVGLTDLPAAVGRMSEQIKALQRELSRLRKEALAVAASRIYAAAEVVNGRHVIVEELKGYGMNELRALGRELQGYPAAAAALASADEGRVSLVVACADEAGLNATDILKQALARIAGRGGGDATLAQGGAAGEADELFDLLAEARRLIGSS